jgi:hypothetical protein
MRRSLSQNSARLLNGTVQCLLTAQVDAFVNVDGLNQRVQSLEDNIAHVYLRFTAAATAPSAKPRAAVRESWPGN